jgi:hypothetical protein
MFDTTYSWMSYMKKVWADPVTNTIEDQIESSVKNISISIFVISILPFTCCYDIGYSIGSNYVQATPTIQKEDTTVEAFVVRRSARLAEKRVKST